MLTRAFDYYVDAEDLPRAVQVATYPVGEGNTGLPELVIRALELVLPDSHEAGRLLSHYGCYVGLRKGDDEGAQKAFGRAVAIAQREGDVPLEMWTLARSGDVEIAYLRPQGCLVKHGQTIELNSRIGDPEIEVAARDCVVTTLMGMGDLQEAQSHAQAMLTFAERARYRRGLLSALSHIAIPALFKGEWQSAREFTDRGLGLDPGDPYCLGIRAMVEYMVGDSDRGEIYLAPFAKVMPHSESGEIVQTVIPLVAYITGDTRHVEVAREAARAFLSSLSVTPRSAWIANIGLVLLAVRQGDQEEAEALYAALKPLRTTFPAEGHICISMDRLLGLLSSTTRQLDQAMAHFEDGLAFCRRAGYRPVLAWSLCDYADALLQRGSPGDRAKAMSLLDEALAISRELQMRPLIERLTERLDRLPSQPPAPQTYPGGLTHREIEVLRLMALGKSNQQIAEELIISLRTVANHVTNILNKTNTPNRTGAAMYASQHGLV